MGGSGDAEALPRTRGLSAAAKHHIELRSKVLEAHPELRALSGPQPLQLLPVLALLCARWGLAYLLRDASLPAIVLTACTVGCWLIHALGTYVHEQGHRLIVRAEPWATAVDVVIEAAITSFGTGTGYQHRHVNFHHRFLGDYEWDSEMKDLCAHVSILRAEDRAWLASRLLQLLEGCLALALPLGGLVAQDVAVALRTALIVPGVHTSDATRTARFALPAHLQRKARGLLVLSVLCHLAAWAAWGWRAALFSLCSVGCKSSRFDVVGWGQDIAEHNHEDHSPTNSTYTLWNWVFCNTGYHNEHHTFPNVPGCYLPRITAAAPHPFLACENRTSWPALWLAWARGSFRNFRLNEQQLQLARAGRCDKAAKAKAS